MAAFRLTVLAALACFSLLPVSRFAAAQTPSINTTSLSVSPALTTTSAAMSTPAAMSTTVPIVTSTTIAPSPTVTSPTVTSTTVTSSSTTATSSSTTATSSSPSPTSFSPSPTSMPSPPAHSYFIYNETTHRVCVLVAGNVQLTFSYTNTSGKSVPKDLAVTSSLNATVDHTNSFCNEDSSTHLVLTFYSDPDFNHSLTFQFNKTKDGYELTSVITYLNFTDSTEFPGYDTNSTDSVTGNTSSIFSASQEKSYKCDSSRTYSMDQEPKGAVKDLKVKISDFQAQAFNFNNMKDQFDKSITCTRDQKTSKIVPIAVGAALAGLVVVVLIAYLIGRFRSRKQNSYEALS